ncbi:DUF58 domain-containing protein [Desulfococcaceae bacterium HSG8]|nr:DUF58 domain-containing protein [Desulfococcaceae bacterium HSG8]
MNISEMIVPKSRLLFWAGIVFLPFGTLATALPSSAALSGSVIAALIIFALADMLFVSGRLEGISVSFPPVVRLSKDHDGNIGLRLCNEKMKVRRLRLGLAFPPEISSESEILTDLPKESTARVSWPCRASGQGRYFLDKCYLETASPLGFWAVRAEKPVHTEIRVYPDLFVERKNLSALFLKKNLGIHTQRQIGKGRDFEQLREYIPGDSYEDIHWKATARRGYPVTKVYQVERTQEIYVIIDGSRLSSRMSNPASRTRGQEPADSFTTIFDRFVTASLVMGMTAERQGDMFGVMAFDDRIRGFVRAKSGKAHYHACRDALYMLQSRTVAPDFAELFTFIGTHIRRRALLIFLTNLDDPVLTESFLHHVDFASRRHLVLVNMMRPKKAAPLFSDSHALSADDLYKHLGGHLLWSSLRETEKILKRSGIGFSMLDNEKMAVQLVSQYLSVKQRQVL